jgi:hypothetical protein
LLVALGAVKKLPSSSWPSVVRGRCVKMFDPGSAGPPVILYDRVCSSGRGGWVVDKGPLIATQSRKHTKAAGVEHMPLTVGVGNYSKF